MPGRGSNSGAGPDMRLHDLTERSGHCYKVRLMLGLLGLDYERVPVDRRAGDNRTAAFLQLNPRALVPVLEDDGTVIWDSSAILTYLALKYGPQWWGTNPAEAAAIMQWLAVAQDEIVFGLQRVRAITLTGRPGSLDEARAISVRALALLEGRLAGNGWLAAARPTVADVACYPYVALSPEGGVDLGPYRGVLAWMDRIVALPGYVAMPPRPQPAGAT